jgi:Mg-chelatase subunit ChlD
LAQKARQYFQTSFHRPDAHSVTIKPEFRALDGGFTLTLHGEAQVDAAFVKLFGISQLRVSTLSQVSWGMKRLELALVLDNTGSMAEFDKIGALKKATYKMFKDLKRTVGNGDNVRVSIVPFDTHVNIGTANRNQPWMDWSQFDGDRDLVRRVSHSHDVHASWNGCIVDRHQPYDVRNSAPTRDPRTFYPAVNCDLTGIQALTSDWDALDRKVGQMKSSGYTNLTIGLVWGWNMLTPQMPLSQAQAPAKDLSKVIVLLTDGKNTQNRWSSSQNEIDARTKTLCESIKKTDIQVFTVRVIEGNASLLRGCATKPEMYYEVNQANGIVAAFDQITDQLTKIYLSR